VKRTRYILFRKVLYNTKRHRQTDRRHIVPYARPIVRSAENRAAELHQFLCMLPMAVARSSSDGVAICYVFPVLRMTSCFHTVGPIGGRTGTALCTTSRLLLTERRPLWEGRPAISQAVLLPRRPRTRDVSRATALQSTRGLLSAYVSSQRL